MSFSAYTIQLADVILFAVTLCVRQEESVDFLAPPSMHGALMVSGGAEVEVFQILRFNTGGS